MNITIKNRYLRNKIIRHFPWMLAVISIITSISAQIGSTGKVKWSKSCDFKGKDLAEKNGIITTKKCEELCVANNRCTHFTSIWTSGKCYLKASNNSVMKENNKDGIMAFATTCGYVINRVCIFKYASLICKLVHYFKLFYSV